MPEDVKERLVSLARLHRDGVWMNEEWAENTASMALARIQRLEEELKEIRLVEVGDG